jgi:hypothetical protein
MILSTMSYQEITKEVNLDVGKIASSSTLPRLTQEYDKQRKKQKIDKKAVFPVYKEIKTHEKNHWIILLNKATNCEKYENVTHIGITFLTYYYQGDKLRVIKSMPSGGIAIYNHHLFQRYNERLGLKIANILGVVKKYFLNNSNVIYTNQKPDELIDSIGVISDGFILGRILDKGKVIINNTFISKSMAFKEQLEKEDHSIKNIEAHLQEFLINYPDHEYTSYVQSILNGILKP